MKHLRGLDRRTFVIAASTSIAALYIGTSFHQREKDNLASRSDLILRAADVLTQDDLPKASEISQYVKKIFGSPSFSEIVQLLEIRYPLTSLPFEDWIATACAADHERGQVFWFAGWLFTHSEGLLILLQQEHQNRIRKTMAYDS